VVKNASGEDSVTVQNCVVVKPLPTAVIMPPSGGICDTLPPDTVFFSLIDTTRGNQYAWLPSGSLTCAACPNPGAHPTIYTVYTLTITGADGCKAVTHDTVTAGYIVAKISGRDSICAGYSDTLIASGGSVGGSNHSSNNPGTTYLWSNGSIKSSIVVNPLVTTTYNVHITSGTAPCQADTTFTVNVFPRPNFSYTVTPADSICNPGTAIYTIKPNENSPYQYSWFGPPYGRVDTDYFVVSPTVSGIYTYTLVVRNIGCYYDSVIKLKVNNPPKVSFTGPTDLCQGSQATITAYGGLQYRWSTGQTTSAINITGVVNTTYTVQVSSGRCFKDTSFTIHVDTMPSFNFKGDTSICVGLGTTIYALPPKGHSNYGYSYLWNQGSTGDSVYTGIIYTPGAYTYYLTIDKGACSKDSSEINVRVFPRPNPKLWPKDTTVCEYDSVMLTATGGNYYIWSASPKPGSLNHYIFYGDTDRNNAAPPLTTMYSVKTCTWGCCSGDTDLHPAIPTPTALLNIIPGVQGYNVCCDTTVTGGTPVHLLASFDPSPYYYVAGWTPSTGLSCTACPNPTATVFNNTTYVVTFFDSYTGCPVTDSVTVDIFNCNVFVPDAFSPNGDGVNDYLYVRSLCLKSMDFAVFDRWGNKVFETREQTSPWDGTYKGKNMDIGTYMWFLSGLEEDGTHISKSGND